MNTKTESATRGWPNGAKHFVAYHNVDLLKRDYEENEKGFCFFTRKRRAFVDKTLGGVLWAITGKKDSNRKKKYRLAAVYQPSNIEEDGDTHLINGYTGLTFRPRPELNDLPWFAELLKEQTNFSFGLNHIKGKRIITELLQLYESGVKIQESNNAETALRPISFQFQEAFRKIGPSLTGKQMEMLKAHYNAPGRKITARQLAAAVGYSGYHSANLQYGKVGSMLCEIMGRKPSSDALYVLAEFIRPGTESNPEWIWRMRDPAARALEELGWVSVTEAFFPTTETEAPPDRIATTINRIIRDTAATKSLKELYHFRCQVCGFQMQVAPGKFYIEAHHVRPLGGEHRGGDSHSNMLVLCPNHHAMFDLWIPQFINAQRVLIGGEEIQIESKHELLKEAVAYYNEARSKLG